MLFIDVVEKKEVASKNKGYVIPYFGPRKSYHHRPRWPSLQFGIAYGSQSTDSYSWNLAEL